MSSDSAETKAGVAYSITGSVFFALIYFYATLLAHLGAAKIYGWRILMTTPFLAGFIFLSGRRKEIAAIWHRLCRTPLLWPGMALSSALLGVQLWLFMWAPVNGYGLDVSLGYFLMPLMLVLTGRLIFGEKISRIQSIACLIAAAGVINELLFAPRVSWPAFVVALGYPLYFALRRKMGTNMLGGMWFDMALSLPLCLWFVLAPTTTDTPSVTALPVGLLITGLGLLTALAMAFMIIASQKLKLGIFGLLSYVEPALLVVVAMLLGERIAPSQWLTYGSIWIAILLLAFEGLRALRQKAGAT